jgi:peptidoglycan/xylan/chitin deacetylase (PgdA/CDA1 family)
MDLEEGLGFRSSIHFVGHDYGVPAGLLREIVDRGFELGIHGWHHDGKLFASRARFMREAAQVNSLAGRWRVNGFRSPMTHREPEWMQDLNVDWDSTFFDTDPYEPMGGGVMSIWPYVLGRFVELPSTMPQDHTLIETLRDPSPRLWLSKLDFIAQHCGMALLNTHPEYLCRHGHLEIYRALLEHICARDGEWRALPGEVASWTRERWQTPSEDTAQPGRSGGARMNVST